MTLGKWQVGYYGRLGIMALGKMAGWVLWHWVKWQVGYYGIG